MASDDYFMELKVENDVRIALFPLIVEKKMPDDIQYIPTPFNTYIEKYGSHICSPLAIGNFHELFGIYLRYIVFHNEIFQVQNNHNFGHNDHITKVAYIVLNKDDTFCGRLFTRNIYEGEISLFEPNDQKVERRVNEYVEGMNKRNLSSIRLPNEDISVDASDSTRTEEQINVFLKCFSDILESKNPNMNKDQTADGLFGTPDLSQVLLDTFLEEQMDMGPTCSSDILESINPNMNEDQTADGLLRISNLSQFPNNLFSPPLTLSIHPRLEAFNTFAYDTSFPLNTTRKLASEASDHFNEEDLSDSRTIDSPVNDAALATIQLLSPSQASQKLYQGPTIILSPKPDWKPRYQSDLIPKHKASGEKKISIGLLQGEGPQRSLVTVKVPTKEEGRGVMYLACTVRTLDNQKHELKLVLPKGTQAIENAPRHGNILNRFNFSNCDPNHFFDVKEQIIYMKITDEEHANEEKQVPVYLINRYQGDHLDKKRIKEQLLDQCRLSFLIYEKVNEVYSCVSHESLSEPIVDT
ncbi:unnamed protein product [Adineta ricciae]|uniref:Uncharacterized protein n=1 Tax=Adineta ricciae TaxID=249248 RepID=A0A814VME8_ADIRI|nr:unnamed protein product [Adineta ricciae]